MRTLTSLLAVLAIPVLSYAQAPAAPPKIWTVQASAGLALTSGNTDTSTVNVAYDLTYDPQTNNVVKSDALWLRGKTQDVLSANRLGINVRDEYRFHPRAFVFGQNQYLRDEFKSIDYLIAPSGGLGYKIVDSTATKLSADAGLGGVWEKNPGVDTRSSGAITVSEKLAQAVTANTTLTQSFSGLWKTKDMDDALYTLSVAIAASMSTRTQLKFEVLDTFKNKPPLPSVEKNDVTVLMALVYKM